MKILISLLSFLICFLSTSQMKVEFNVKHVVDSSDAEVSIYVHNSCPPYHFVLKDSSYNTIDSLDLDTLTNTYIDTGYTEGVYYLSITDDSAFETLNTYFFIGKYGFNTNVEMKLRPEFMIDASIGNHPTNINSNFETHPYLFALSGNSGGYGSLYRVLFKYTFNGLYESGIIDSANFSLNRYYAEPGANNSMWLKKIDNKWKEDSVTWNFPSLVLDDEGMINVPSTNSTGYFSTNITTMIELLRNDKDNNNGFSLMLQDENPPRGYYFYSSDNSDNTKWPKLFLSYKLPSIASSTAIYKKVNAQPFKLKTRELIFNFEEEYNDSDGLLSFNIYDENKNIVDSEVNQSVNITKGNNSCKVYFKDCLGEGNYLLKVTNEKSESWFLNVYNPFEAIGSCN